MTWLKYFTLLPLFAKTKQQSHDINFEEDSEKNPSPIEVLEVFKLIIIFLKKCLNVWSEKLYEP